MCYSLIRQLNRHGRERSGDGNVDDCGVIETWVHCVRDVCVVENDIDLYLLVSSSLHPFQYVASSLGSFSVMRAFLLALLYTTTVVVAGKIEERDPVFSYEYSTESIYAEDLYPSSSYALSYYPSSSAFVYPVSSAVDSSSYVVYSSAYSYSTSAYLYDSSSYAYPSSSDHGEFFPLYVKR